jgi:hypothetical protein
LAHVAGIFIHRCAENAGAAAIGGATDRAQVCVSRLEKQSAARGRTPVQGFRRDSQPEAMRPTAAAPLAAHLPDIAGDIAKPWELISQRFRDYAAVQTAYPMP